MNRSWLFFAAAAWLLLAPGASGDCRAAAAAYQYDVQKRLVSVLYGDGSRIVYTYDKAGNRTMQVIGDCRQSAGIRGDLDADCVLTLRDAVIALQIVNSGPGSGLRGNFGASGADVGGDARVDLGDAVYILQHLP